MHEREKHKHSIILKGLTATTCEGATNEPRGMSAKLLGSEADIQYWILSVWIPPSTCDKQCNDLLTKDKTLMDITEFSHIFIHRDLMHRQCQDLFQIRTAACNVNSQSTSRQR